MKYDAVLLEATSIVLRRLREEVGLSQEDLAASSGITRSMIDKVERRERLPSLDILIKIAPALKKTASEIVSLIEGQLKK
jgi:transcriptional regulator with XRE-family HTH domain